jgi:hypothetical protein
MRIPVVKDNDTVVLFNLALALLCLTYLYYRLDKDLAHVYRYAKTLDTEVTKLASKFEVDDADNVKVQDASP